MYNSSENSGLLHLSLPFLCHDRNIPLALWRLCEGGVSWGGGHMFIARFQIQPILSVHDRGLIECGASYQKLTLDIRLSRWATMRNRDTFGMRHPGNTCLIVRELYSCTQTSGAYWQIYFYRLYLRIFIPTIAFILLISISHRSLSRNQVNLRKKRERYLKLIIPYLLFPWTKRVYLDRDR